MSVRMTLTPRASAPAMNSSSLSTYHSEMLPFPLVSRLDQPMSSRTTLTPRSRLWSRSAWIVEDGAPFQSEWRFTPR
jgi:hypothetical protein